MAAYIDKLIWQIPTEESIILNKFSNFVVILHIPPDPCQNLSSYMPIFSRKKFSVRTKFQLFDSQVFSHFSYKHIDNFQNNFITG